MADAVIMIGSLQAAKAKLMQQVTITRMKPLLYSLLASLVLVLATAAHSAPPVAGLLGGLPQVGTLQVGGSQQNVDNTPQVSPAQAAQTARQRYGGKVLSVDLQPGGNYRVKIIDHGNVRVVRIPAN